MSDVDVLPATAGVFFAALALLALSAAGAFICLVIASRRAQLNARPLVRQRFFGYACGAAATAVASGVMVWLVEISLPFARLVKGTSPAAVAIVLLIALWPVVGHFWNRQQRRR